MLSCRGRGEVELPQEEAIAFAYDLQDEQSAVHGVAPRRASSPLCHDFTVWGYKTLPPDNVQLVFRGYDVTYVPGSAGSSTDNNYDYSYVDPSKNQSVKYWDFGATEYNFWAATLPNDPADPNAPTFSSDGTTLTIPGLVLTTSEPDVAFSSLYHRSPVTNDVVRLEFKRPYAQVRVMFYSGETLEDGDVIEIGETTFGPEEPSKIISAGTLKVTYSKSGAESETYSTDITTEGSKLTFSGVNLTHTAGTSSSNAALARPAVDKEYYYVVPYQYSSPFTLATSIDSDSKTATIPASYMHWLPNYVYTYIFKITEAGKKIEFYDVKIDPWKYGGSQDEEWKNW